METPQPRLHRQQHLSVRVATPASLIVEVEGVAYYVTCVPKHDNPAQGGP